MLLICKVLPRLVHTLRKDYDIKPVASETWVYGKLKEYGKRV